MRRPTPALHQGTLSQDAPSERGWRGTHHQERMVDRAVTVVIPTKDRREQAVRAARFAVAQRGVEVACIVIDDGSTDGTADAIAGLGDSRVTVIRNERAGGAAAARNRGLDRVTTPWTAFLDDDDLWAPDKLAAQLDALDGMSCARWSATACVNVNSRLEVLTAYRMPVLESLANEMVVENYIPAGSSTVVVDTELAREVGGFDSTLGNCEDWDMWIRLARRAPLAYVDRPLVAYQVWEGGKSTNLADMKRGRNMIMARYGERRTTADLRYQGMTWHQHVAAREVAKNRRGTAARHYIAAAVIGRAPGQMLYAAAAVVSPGAVERRLGRLSAASIPPGWKEAADEWLAGHR
jgi:glycosyltransferase involved in cell wall biosynthesis